MQHYLNYDIVTGNITDKTGFMVATYIGAAPVDISSGGASGVDEVIKLKTAGFTAEEIIEMKKAGL